MPLSPPAVFHAIQPLQLEILLMHFREVTEWNFNDLRAPYWRLYHNPTPGAVIKFKGKQSLLSPDFIYILPAELEYASSMQNSFHQLYIHFLIKAGSKVECSPKLYKIKINQEMAQQLRVLEAATPLSPLLTQITALALLAKALSGLPVTQSKTPAMAPHLMRALTHLQQCVHTGVSNETLAHVAAMNPNAFIRAFRKATGKTPQSFLTGIRIDEACLLLHHGNESIDAIAERCGFCDRFHFSRVFKACRGVPPGVFRQQNYLPDNAIDGITQS